jgi:hypothetical protein
MLRLKYADEALGYGREYDDRGRESPRKCGVELCSEHRGGTFSQASAALV